MSVYKVAGWTVLVAVFLMLVALTAPLTQKWKDECDRRGGFYDYKSTTCWSDGGYEVLSWSR